MFMKYTGPNIVDHELVNGKIYDVDNRWNWHYRHMSRIKGTEVWVNRKFLKPLYLRSSLLHLIVKFILKLLIATILVTIIRKLFIN